MSSSQQADEQFSHQELAAIYRDRARKLRQRAQAAHQAGEAQHAQENAERADYYDQRAAYTEQGAAMPRSLRTPLENMRMVDVLRQGVAETLVNVLDLELDRGVVGQFANEVGGEGWGTSAAEAFDRWQEWTDHLLRVLGGRPDAQGLWAFEVFDSRRWARRVGNLVDEQQFFARPAHQPPPQQQPRAPLASPEWPATSNGAPMDVSRIRTIPSGAAPAPAQHQAPPAAPREQNLTLKEAPPAGMIASASPHGEPPPAPPPGPSTNNGAGAPPPPPPKS